MALLNNPYIIDIIIGLFLIIYTRTIPAPKPRRNTPRRFPRNHTARSDRRFRQFRWQARFCGCLPGSPAPAARW